MSSSITKKNLITVISNWGYYLMHIKPISILDKLEDGSLIEKFIITALAADIFLTSYPLNSDSFMEGAKQGVIVGIATALFDWSRILLFSNLINYLNYFENNPDKENNKDKNIFHKFFKYLNGEYIGSIITGPIDEEIIMRGGILPLIKFGLLNINISPYYSSIFSVISSALIFGLMHNPREEGQQFAAFCSGIAYAYLKEKNNNLWAPTIAHMTHNASVMLVAGMLDYGFSLLKPKTSHKKPTIYTKDLPQTKEKVNVQSDSITIAKSASFKYKKTSCTFFSSHKRKKRNHKFRDITDEEMADSVFGQRSKLKIKSL